MIQIHVLEAIELVLVTSSMIGDVDLKAWTHRSSQLVRNCLEQFSHANVASICDCDIGVTQKIGVDDKG